MAAQRTDRGRGPQPNRAGTRSVTAARRSPSGRAPLLAGIGVLVVLVVVIVVGIVLTHRSSTTGAIPPVRVGAANYPVALQEGVVVAGQSGAKTTVDAYEDFLCPVCGRFESQHGQRVEQALAAGRIDVRYHLLNLLDTRSNPSGYSLQAANAGMCAAEAGIFPSYHASLYGKQPDEGGAGYTVDQLVALGKDLGAPGGFEPCVRTGGHNAQVMAQLDTAGKNPQLQQSSGSGKSFGTPTVLVNGMVIPVLTQAGGAQFDVLLGQG